MKQWNLYHNGRLAVEHPNQLKSLRNNKYVKLKKVDNIQLGLFSQLRKNDVHLLLDTVCETPITSLKVLNANPCFISASARKSAEEALLRLQSIELLFLNGVRPVFTDSFLVRGAKKSIRPLPTLCFGFLRKITLRFINFSHHKFAVFAKALSNATGFQSLIFVGEFPTGSFFYHIAGVSKVSFSCADPNPRNLLCYAKAKKDSNRKLLKQPSKGKTQLITIFEYNFYYSNVAKAFIPSLYNLHCQELVDLTLPPPSYWGMREENTLHFAQCMSQCQIKEKHPSQLSHDS